MIRIAFQVVGEPAHQPRPRARAVRMNGRWIGTVYHPDPKPGTRSADAFPDFMAVKLWKNAIAAAARQHLPPVPLSGAVRVDIDFLFARPQYLLKPKIWSGEIRHIVKPDRDNLDKAALDALTEVGMFADDCKVCDGCPRKFWVARGGQPGARIIVTQLEAEHDGAGPVEPDLGLFDERISLFEEA